MTSERLPERSIPDRGPGHAFIAIAHRGLVEGLECDGSLESVPRSIHPHLNPLPSRARRKGAKAHFHAIDAGSRQPCGWKLTGDSDAPPPPPQRGTSPSPRVVFDRTTFLPPRPLLDSGLRWKDELGAVIDDGMPRFTNYRPPSPGHAFIAISSCRLPPARQGIGLGTAIHRGSLLRRPTKLRTTPLLDSGPVSVYGAGIGIHCGLGKAA